MADPSPPVGIAALRVEDLVDAAKSGNRAAFGELYERFARLVHGVLLANVDRDDVDDLLQEVFLRALRRLHTLREPAAFGAWIATMARNEARMHHRARKNTVELSDDLPGPVVESASLGIDDLLRALRALPERYREPLVLRLVNRMGGEEIAAQMGLSHGTVRVYLHHGIRLLRERLNPGATNG